MQNNITDKKYHNLSNDAYRISERSVKEKRLISYGKFNILNAKRQPRKLILAVFFYLFCKKKGTRIIITIL